MRVASTRVKLKGVQKVVAELENGNKVSRARLLRVLKSYADLLAVLSLWEYRRG